MLSYDANDAMVRFCKKVAATSTWAFQVTHKVTEREIARVATSMLMNGRLKALRVSDCVLINGKKKCTYLIELSQ